MDGNVAGSYVAHADRKIWLGFWSDERKGIDRIVKSVRETLSPVRVIQVSDSINLGQHVKLRKPLPAAQFDLPIVEQYPPRKSYFFGLYYPEPVGTHLARTRIPRRAVEFFEQVSETLDPVARRQNLERDVYV